MNAEPPHPFAANPDPAHLIDVGVVRDLERWWHRYSDVVDIDEADLFRLLLAIGQMAREGGVGWELLPDVPGHDRAVTRYDGPHIVAGVTFTLQYTLIRPLGRDTVVVLGIALARPERPTGRR
ncbi:MAG: hypothetical protein OEY70_18495 [Acidimicrobiia bacterium]|nr:hypothetical protein [Acidimicrobiia bacterium]